MGQIMAKTNKTTTTTTNKQTNNNKNNKNRSVKTLALGAPIDVDLRLIRSYSEND